MILPHPSDQRKRIRGTDRCYQREQRIKRDGEYTWTPISYHSTLGSAVAADCEDAIRTSPASTLTEAIEAVHKVVSSYEKILFGAVQSLQSRIERL